MDASVTVEVGVRCLLRLARVHGVGPAGAGGRWAHVCDRGGDSLEAMQLAGDRHQEFPARTHQDRRVIVTGVDKGTEQERGAIRSPYETTWGIAPATTKGARVASRGGRPARGVKVQIGSRPAILRPPRPDGARRGLRPLRVTPMTPEEIERVGRATERSGGVPSVKQFVGAVARLGGHPGRSAGLGTPWRGYQRSKDMPLGAEPMRETANGDPPRTAKAPPRPSRRGENGEGTG